MAQVGCKVKIIFIFLFEEFQSFLKQLNMQSLIFFAEKELMSEYNQLILHFQKRLKASYICFALNPIAILLATLYSFGTIGSKIIL